MKSNQAHVIKPSMKSKAQVAMKKSRPISDDKKKISAVRSCISRGKITK